MAQMSAKVLNHDHSITALCDTTMISLLATQAIHNEGKEVMLQFCRPQADFNIAQ
jgi:hypothetical protein